jgi:hypothetical protein
MGIVKVRLVFIPGAWILHDYSLWLIFPSNPLCSLLHENSVGLSPICTDSKPNPSNEPHVCKL